MSNKNIIETKIKENEPLAQYTTYKIGGPAKYFVVAENEEEIIAAVNWAEEKGEKTFILGGGTNILVSDDGFDGLVIKIKNKGFEVKDNIINVDAGVNFGKIVSAAIKHELTGLEWAIGIPGTIGGAVRGNAGAFGKGIGDVIETVRVLDNNKIKEYLSKDLKFGYRDSILKGPKKNEIVLSAKIKLKKGNSEESKSEIKGYLEKRNKHPLNFPCAGCVFKNVPLIKGKLELADPTQGDIKDFLKREIPEAFIELGKIPSGYLVDLVDLKGKKIGNVQISPKHANYIVNLGDGKAEEVVMLISHIKARVRDETGIQLQEEIQLVGF